MREPKQSCHLERTRPARSRPAQSKDPYLAPFCRTLKPLRIIAILIVRAYWKCLNHGAMRIISVRIAPVARLLAIAYAFLGLVSFLRFAFENARTITLPIGLVFPPFLLNFNLILTRRDDLIYNALLCGAAIGSFALTGWITGIAAALCFNFIAKQTGGIDAKYVSVIPDKSSVKAPEESPIEAP